ncbi:transmembrane protein 53 [Megalops cyprinoides]|uniref:transmembrane protein 53 n=1 Tax=Megalops cyprinoides TaxID=118141 RepID=UPI00186535AD|nr:transmembrane protein 53 [Megalops cyprinoides]
MGDVDIDYNIVFPEACITEKYWQGSKEPVVMLLGWAGCKDKHLSKYSSIYNEQGCITVRYTAPLKTVFISESFGYKELSTIAHKLLELLYDYEVENNPIFFHVFSNGGFMLYRYMAELLCSHGRFSTLKVVGTVVDSAPGSQNVRGALRAITASLGPNINVVLLYFLLALFACMVFLLRIVLYSVTKYIHKNHYDALRDSPSPWPQLYLYSRADRVIRHRDVELMVKAVQEKGVPVDSFDFGTPAHVSLFRDFPEEYSRRCLDFLASCMQKAAGAQKKKQRFSVPN